MVQGVSLHNARVLELLQQASMVLFLDSRKPESGDQISRFLHLREPRGCWFLKHQYVVFANGQGGINFEESMGDGSTTIRLADFLYEESYVK